MDSGVDLGQYAEHPLPSPGCLGAASAGAVRVGFTVSDVAAVRCSRTRAPSRRTWIPTPGQHPQNVHDLTKRPSGEVDVAAAWARRRHGGGRRRGDVPGLGARVAAVDAEEVVVVLCKELEVAHDAVPLGFPGGDDELPGAISEREGFVFWG